MSTLVCVSCSSFIHKRGESGRRAVTRLDGNHRFLALEYISTKAAKMRRQNPADIHTPGTCMPSVSPLTNKRNAHKHARKAQNGEREKGGRWANKASEMGKHVQPSRHVIFSSRYRKERKNARRRRKMVAASQRTGKHRGQRETGEALITNEKPVEDAANNGVVTFVLLQDVSRWRRRQVLEEQREKERIAFTMQSISDRRNRVKFVPVDMHSRDPVLPV